MNYSTVNEHYSDFVSSSGYPIASPDDRRKAIMLIERSIHRIVQTFHDKKFSDSINICAMHSDAVKNFINGKSILITLLEFDIKKYFPYENNRTMPVKSVLYYKMIDSIRKEINMIVDKSFKDKFVSSMQENTDYKGLLTLQVMNPVNHQYQTDKDNEERRDRYTDEFRNLMIK